MGSDHEIDASPTQKDNHQLDNQTDAWFLGSLIPTGKGTEAFSETFWLILLYSCKKTKKKSAILWNTMKYIPKTR